MYGVVPPTERAPLFYFGNLAVYFTTLLVIVHAVGMVVWAVAYSVVGRDLLLPVFGFSSASSLVTGQLWQFVTYMLVNPVDLFLIIELVFLYWWGRELERFFGRQTFIKIYLILLIGPAVLFTVFYHLFETLLGWGFPDMILYSTNSIPFVFFVAFAVISPRAQLIFGIEARWFAIAIIALHTLVDLSQRDFRSMLVFWTEILLVYVCIRYYGVVSRFPKLEQALSFGRFGDDGRTPRRKGGKGKKKSSGRKKKSAPPSADEEVKSVDLLLEKISAHGFGSLSDKEKELLAKASDKMKKGKGKK